MNAVLMRWVNGIIKEYSYEYMRNIGLRLLSTTAFSYSVNYS